MLPIKEEKVKKQSTMNDVEKQYNEMIKYPIDSKPYYTNEKKIRELLSEIYDGNDPYIIATPSFSHMGPSLIPCDEITHVNMLGCDNDVFDTTKRFVDDSRFVFVPRSESEYNLKYKQLVVCALITDYRGNVLLLNTLKGRMAGKYTMIQGHVEYSQECLTKCQHEILRINMLRELNEEIKANVDFSKYSNFDMTYVNIHDEYTDLEHFGVVYKMKLPQNLDEYKFESNEPEKHKVVIFKASEKDDPDYNLDTWVKRLLM